MKFMFLILCILIKSNFIFCLDIYEKKELSLLTNGEKINGFISNYFTHETFLNNTEDISYLYESSIIFIIGENEIKSLYIANNAINPPAGGITVTLDRTNGYNIYRISSDYIYIPKYLIFNGDHTNTYSKLLAFCTEGFFISVYSFKNNNNYLNQEFYFENGKNYEDFKLYATKNKCSSSAYIGQNDFGDRVFVSNSYSILMNENNWNLYYDIKIFEYMVNNNEINYFIGKSFNVEIIDSNTMQQSYFDKSLLNGLKSIFNKEGSSLIKCKIINSYINLLINSDISYDKEILILCLYYTKDLENSLPSEPKLSIRLDLFKNDLGDNDLNLISYITLKNSIKIDKEDTEGNNYLYPDLITFKNNEGEIYITLKGALNMEIYTVNLDINNLLLSNAKLNLSKTYNNELVDFIPREFMGSFYFSEYNIENNKLKVFIYGDLNKKNYEETKIELSDITTDQIIKTEITSLSSYLLSLLLVTNYKAYIVFILFPLCEPINTKIWKKCASIGTYNINHIDLIPSDIKNDDDYLKIFPYQNFIIDELSRSNSRSSTKLIIDFDENYLTSEEKGEIIIIKYNDDAKKSLSLEPKSHIEKLKILYNLYFFKDNNKYYSPTCSFLIDICHHFCSKCNGFSSDDDNPNCQGCLPPYYFAVEGPGGFCKNIKNIPIEGYYFDYTDQKFKICNSGCKHCIGETENDCLSCQNGDYLSETNLKYIIINNKTYEYSNCKVCNRNNHFAYTNYNFKTDYSTNVCLDDSSGVCPDNFPFMVEYDSDNITCFQNCKNSDPINIYGNINRHSCEENCDKGYFFYENNTCVDCIDCLNDCPDDYYKYELKNYCIKKCGNNLYHVKIEKEDIDRNKYFELRCENACPADNSQYYFFNGENNKFCLPSCEQFEYYYGNEIGDKYDIYYKNSLVCFSKSQCNNYKDEYSTKKYVALINSTSTQKRLCVSECKEVSQYLLPQSFLLDSNYTSEVDCVLECPEGYGNYSWKCIECSSIYLFLYEKNCIKDCPPNSYKIDDYPYNCFSKCPEDFPYADNIRFRCYKTLEEITTQKDRMKCDKTKFLWYTDYDVNNIPFYVCLNETNIYLTCDAVVQEFPYTNKLTHECVRRCPDYMIQNENTKYCEIDLNNDLNFSIILEALLSHELTNTTTTKNESNIIRYSRDANSELTISFYLTNYSIVLEKLRNNINPEVSVQETNGDIRNDESSPFYYANGTDFTISDQCENLLRERYGIGYYTEIEYNDTIIEFINGLKKERIELKKYYVPKHLLGIIMEIKRDNTSQVEYKLFNPDYPYRELNLGFCNENPDGKINKVVINIEKKLTGNIYSLFDEVFSYYISNIDQAFEGKKSEKYVYDIFNKNSDFFASPCTPFASKYGTDILSVDRFEKFYTEINFCEDNCTYLGAERSFKNGENYILAKCECDLKDRYYKGNEINFKPNYEGESSNYDIDFQTIQSNFICFKKILNIKSIFSKENILGLITLILFILIISLYIIQCMTSTSNLDETLKMIRLGKYDHGLNIFYRVKDYEKEQAKRDESYQRRKELKKVKLIKEKPKSMNIIQAKHKIKKAENNIKRKFEGKKMIPDEKKDELEIMRERVKDLEDQLKLKYQKKGKPYKKIKIKLKEDPEEIKKIKQEIKLTKKHLEDLRRQKKEIDLEKLKYHSFSSMGSLPQNPPKRLLSEMPMLDEIDDDAIASSKEKMVNKKIIKKNINKKSKEKKIKDKEKNDIIKKEDEKKEEEKINEENQVTNKEDILSLNKTKEKENEEKKEEEKEEIKEEEKKESNLDSSWESYDSKDPEGKAKKEKEKLDKKNKEKKEREIQKKLIEKRIKEIERRIELLPEEAKHLRKLLEKEKRKKEILEKGLPLEEIIKVDNEVIKEDSEEENDLNINNEKTNNEEVPEENLSEMEEKEEEEDENNEKISEKKTQNEIIKVKKKKVKDEFFKNILKKKYQFKYMRLFYEEYPYNFIREYSIISFNDLFTSNDYFYYYVDVELNDMIYRRALKEDRRSFCSMYWSFIKYKNNFIFCFIKDYFNIIPIKIAILIYSLSLYPLFSCLFINDKIIHKIYIESNNLQKKDLLRTDPISITQYIFSPIIIEIIIFLLKKFILIEKDIIEFIHKKKYHSNYILQEMVKGHDVRDEKDEKEKKEILLSIQNMNKNKENKENKEKDAFFSVDGKEFKKKEKPDYAKEFEENKTLINELRMEMANYLEKVNNKITFFFLGAFLLSLFNFYYVTVFTMTYYNCVEKIFFGTLIPFAVNFLYPFVNCFVFVAIRYFSLNRGFINLYKLSKILSYI